MKPLYIPDEIEGIVTLTNEAVLDTIKANEEEALGETRIEKVNFAKGHYQELLETLAQKDGTSYAKFKYPLVYLQQDFTERRTGDGFYCEVRMRLILIHQTLQEYKSQDRYAKVFKPVLYPIYYELLKQIAGWKQIVESDDQRLVHNKTDRVYWGTAPVAEKTEVNLNDHVDAIDIEDLELQFYIKNC